MWTSDEIRARHERLFQKMRKAGWIQHAVFTPGKGYHVTWSERGAIGSMILKHWHELLHLADSDTRPIAAYKLAHGITFGVVGDREVEDCLGMYVRTGLATAYRASETAVSMDWTPDGLAFTDRFCRICSELGLSADADDLIILFGIAADWAPDGNTPIRSVDEN